ncbi:MAG: (5-formylfuran-3-yl)methyl phosphate synthase [Planctomycetia bacterium]
MNEERGAATRSTGAKTAEPVKLLVSVRSAEEAEAALVGGADVVDVKEPDRGPLGAADDAVIAAVVEVVAAFNADRRRDDPRKPPVWATAALGELGDWTAGGRDPATLPDGLAMVKVGMAGCSDPTNRASSPLRNFFLYHEFLRRLPLGLPLTPVAYADYERAAAPTLSAVAMLALTLPQKSPFLLIDTYVKDGLGLWEWLTPAEIGALVDRLAVRRIGVALAGSLREADFPAALTCRPSVVAVRGAACAEGDRTGRVTAERVAALRKTLTALQTEE